MPNSLSCLPLIIIGLPFCAFANEPNIADAFELIQSGRTEQALPILEPLAKKGNSKAMVALGYYFLLERDNETEGLAWFEKAALSNDPEGQLHFGLVLTDVIGRDEDIAEGVEWLEKAGDQGNRIAAIKLSEIYYSGKGNVGKNSERYSYWNERAQIQ